MMTLGAPALKPPPSSAGMPFCYVVGGLSCTTASASTAFPGAAWKGCTLSPPPAPPQSPPPLSPPPPEPLQPPLPAPP
eukprot:5181183-Prymnesium_polylepis.2